MPITPNVVSITYQKYSGLVPSTMVELTNTGSSDIFTEVPKIIDKPNWVNLILEETLRNDDNEIIKFIYRVAVIPPQANNLSEGFHSGIVKIKARFKLGGVFSGTYSPSFTINLRIVDQVLLSISQSIYLFKYTIGATAPTAQYLTIDTSNNWSIVATESWLLFSVANGSGRQVISLNVNVAGLPPGHHTSRFLVDDGVSQKEGYVALGISGEGEDDYLNVSPSQLEFSETYLKPSTSEAVLRVDSSLPAVVTSDVNWLALSAENLPAGITSVTITAQNTDILQIGSYPAEIKIASAYSVRVLNLLLHVVEVTSSGIESNGFYFADDRNTLSLSTGTSNAEAVIDFKTLGTLEVKNYTKRTPFYRNLARVIIGMETHILLRPYALPPLATQAYTPVEPIIMNFTLYEKSLSTAAMVEREVYSNVRFLNGITPPKPNILTHIPASITTPKDGVIAFSFLESGAAVDTINITGAVTMAIPVNPPGTSVHGIFVNLADLALKPYDVITISCGPINILVKIKPTEIATCKLIFLNEWDCPEIINLDGALQVIHEDGSTTVVNNRAGKEYSSILEVKKPRSYRIGTGNIHSDAEVQHLAEILNSKKSWLQIGDETIEVIRTFRNLPVFETRRNTRNFMLTFDNAIK